MTLSDYLIEAVDLRRVFHPTEALAGISFSFQRGEIFGLPAARAVRAGHQQDHSRVASPLRGQSRS